LPSEFGRVIVPPNRLSALALVAAPSDFHDTCTISRAIPPVVSGGVAMFCALALVKLVSAAYPCCMFRHATITADVDAPATPPVNATVGACRHSRIAC
jgi:hypothetical protein